LQETLYFYRVHPNQSVGIKNKLVQDQNVQKICSYIVNLYWNSKSNSDVELYYKFLRQKNEIKAAKDFIIWDGFLKRLYQVSKEQNYINLNNLKDFVFVNDWLSSFTNCFTNLSFLDLIKVLNSSFCKFSKLTKLKFLIKKIIHKTNNQVKL
jgi:hypothetical protein